MKITLKELRSMIREEMRGLFEAAPKNSKSRKPLLDQGSRFGGRSYDPNVDTVDELVRDAVDLFQQVGTDLLAYAEDPTEDPSNPAFLDYVGDAMVDVGVPREVSARVKQRLAKKQLRPLGESFLAESEEDDEEAALELSRTPEYSSVDSLAEYLIDDDRAEFTHVDLKALHVRLKKPVAQIRKELEEYGLSLAKREPPRRVRGFTTSSNDRWFGPGSLPTHGGAGIDTSTGRATVRGKTV